MVEKTESAKSFGDVEASRRGHYARGPHSDLKTSGDVVTLEEERDLKRGLAQRHVSMIALAGAYLLVLLPKAPSALLIPGAIGTGLFLSLGGSIATGGPLGSLLAYIFVGLIVCAVQFALGEVTALLPVTGSFVRHAEFLVDPALGFALGWTIVYGTWLSVRSTAALT